MRVWLSRSRPGADRQAADLRSAGYDVVVAPVVGIEALDVALPDGPYGYVIFLSEHAVRLGLHTLAGLRWFAHSRVLAVGARTGGLLAGRGIAVDSPGDAGSEGLLSLECLQHLDGVRVLLVCGRDGRALLGETLGRRGAEVRRFECYRRVPVTALPPAALTCDVVIAASGEGLEQAASLWLGAGGRAEVPVLVPSARVARLGVELGLGNLHDCHGADSDAWLRGLATLHSGSA